MLPITRQTMFPMSKQIGKTLIKPSSLIAKRSFIKTIPQPPGNIVGTVNDAYVAPPSSKLHGSRHWSFERAVTVGLIPFSITPFVFGSVSPLIDVGSVFLLFHCNSGFQSCIIDYIPKRLYGWLHNAAIYLLHFGTAVSLFGIYEMQSKDIALSDLVVKVFS